MSTNEKVVIERTYEARIDEVWDLWTTKQGFESWWGPEGFRVEVHAIDPRVGGILHYDMIADTPEMIAAMKEMGHPPSHATRGTFSELQHHERLALRQLVDFVPGVTPYDTTMSVQFIPSGTRVRMVVTIDPLHTAEFTKMSEQGFTSQLTKLDKRFRRAA